jgi:hypothetical protein
MLGINEIFVFMKLNFSESKIQVISAFLAEYT